MIKEKNEIINKDEDKNIDNINNNKGQEKKVNYYCYQNHQKKTMS